MKTLLIIGGTGFFGKSILDFYQRGGLDRWEIGRVVAMSRNVHKINSEAPSLLSPRVELISADITTADELPAADYVIHAAASTDAKNYLNHPMQERINIHLGARNYCRLAKKFHANSKIIFTSSGAVYGNQPESEGTLSETSYSNGIKNIQQEKYDYAHAKREAENSIRQLGIEGVSVSIARCFSFVGPWLPRNQHFAIGNFIEDGLKRRPISVKASHCVYRSYMYADDLVEWLMTIAENSNSECPTFNVGSDQAILVGDLAKLIGMEFGQIVDVPDIIDPMIDRYVPSIQKIREQLDVQIKFDLISAIKKTIFRINSNVLHHS